MTELEFAIGMINVLITSATHQLNRNDEEAADKLFELALYIAAPYPELKNAIRKAAIESKYSGIYKL